MADKYPHIQFKRNWDLNTKCIYQLGQCSSLINIISNLPLQPDYHAKLLRVSLIKGALATTAIEGNTLTEKDIDNIQKGQSLPPSKEYQEIEVRNILDALNALLEEVVVDDRVSFINPRLLKRFHKMVGKDLGKHFDAVPGQFRKDRRIVGTYRTPDPEDVESLVKSLCEWLRAEFKFNNEQHFSESVIQAIITHVYIEWIHPFGDGNGRTGRLVEFYILLRAGTPDIGSHILSNYYNQTRPEYYRQIANAIEKMDLTDFINYAVEGYRDGLLETLSYIQDSLVKISWRTHIYDSFAEKKYRKKGAFKRKRNLMLELKPNIEYSIDDLLLINPRIARDYANLSIRTILRDLEELQHMNLIVKEKDKYIVNAKLLQKMIPAKKK